MNFLMQNYNAIPIGFQQIFDYKNDNRNNGEYMQKGTNKLPAQTSVSLDNI